MLILFLIVTNLIITTLGTRLITKQESLLIQQKCEKQVCNKGKNLQHYNCIETCKKLMENRLNHHPDMTLDMRRMLIK
jgi:hypothetical protein